MESGKTQSCRKEDLQGQNFRHPCNSTSDNKAFADLRISDDIPKSNYIPLKNSLEKSICFRDPMFLSLELFLLHIASPISLFMGAVLRTATEN